MYNDNDDIMSPTYKSLSEIRLRKAQLLTEITKDSHKMKGMWDELFHKPKNQATPTRRFSGLMNTGAGILDAAILGWKLYRKFGGKSKSKSGFFRR